MRKAAKASREAAKSVSEKQMLRLGTNWSVFAASPLCVRVQIATQPSARAANRNIRCV